MTYQPYPRTLWQTIRFRICRWLGPKLWMLGYQLSLYGATDAELARLGEDLKAMGWDKKERIK